MISLVEVNEENWRDITELSVADEQTAHIESNAQSQDMNHWVVNEEEYSPSNTTEKHRKD